MLKWALIFFIIAIVAALFGFTGIVASAASIAKWLLFLTIAVFVSLVIAALVPARSCSRPDAINMLDDSGWSCR